MITSAANACRLADGLHATRVTGGLPNMSTSSIYHVEDVIEQAKRKARETGHPWTVWRCEDAGEPSTYYAVPTGTVTGYTERVAVVDEDGSVPIHAVKAGEQCFMFQAAFYCEACGEHIREKLRNSGLAPAEEHDEYTYDNDDFPKGPYYAEQDEYCDAMDDCLSLRDTTTT